MNPRLKKFKLLTTWIDEDRIENLLEGTLYLKEAFSFIDLLLLLDKEGYSYGIVSAFKGETHFQENQNKFKDIVLELFTVEDVDHLVEFFNSTNLKKLYTVIELTDNNLQIQLKS